MRVAARIGGRAPLHCTANGKVLLAFQPNEVIEKRARPEPDTRKIRSSTRPCFAVSLPRSDKPATASNGKNSLPTSGHRGAPVFDFNGTVIAAIAVVGPSARDYRRADRSACATHLRTAESISVALAINRIKTLESGSRTGPASPAESDHAIDGGDLHQSRFAGDADCAGSRA